MIGKIAYPWLGGFLLFLCWGMAPQAVSAGQDAEAPLVSTAAEPAEGGESEPVVAPARDKRYAAFESAPIAGARGADAPSGSEGGEQSPFGPALRLIGGLVVIVAVMGGGMYLFRKLLPGRGRLFGGGAAEVLGRTYLDSRRYVALVRVGKRVLVVGVGPEQIGALGELSDPDEVAEVMRQSGPASESGKQTFRSLLEARAGREPAALSAEDADDRVAAPGGEAAGLERAMDSIHARIRGLRKG